VYPVPFINVHFSLTIGFIKPISEKSGQRVKRLARIKAVAQYNPLPNIPCTTACIPGFKFPEKNQATNPGKPLPGRGTLNTRMELFAAAA
jgi:hypothetical protein